MYRSLYSSQFLHFLVRISVFICRLTSAAKAVLMVCSMAIYVNQMNYIYIRYMQNAHRFTELFSNIPAFRQVLRVPQPIHLTRAEYHNYSWFNIHE